MDVGDVEVVCDLCCFPLGKRKEKRKIRMEAAQAQISAVARAT